MVFITRFLKPLNLSLLALQQAPAFQHTLLPNKLQLCNRRLFFNSAEGPDFQKSKI